MDKLALSRSIARNLLQLKAIKFNFREPYTWASGWKSPVYCDNRITLSDHHVRSIIRDAYTEVIQELFPEVEVIAGVATGAIAQGALVADKLGVPFVYVREKAKDHGLMKVIEGKLEQEQKIVIVEDLISTGGSSLKVADELRKAKANVLGMVANFSYEFPLAIERFSKNNCKLYTLSTFSMLKNVALDDGYITKDEVEILTDWHQNPQDYSI